jgi:hypothetical protein
VAQAAAASGYEVAAVVDVRPNLPPSEALAAAYARGIPVLTGHVVLRTIHAAALAGVRLAPLAAQGTAFEVACDTIVSAIDLVPNVEMFDLLGCRIVWHPGRGGFVPEVDGEGRTSVPFAYAAGDCAGVSDAALVDPALAATAGRRAARAAARDAGIAAEALATADPETLSDRDLLWREWLAAHMAQAGELMICRCEDVGLRDLLGVRPPRYVAYDEAKFADRDLRSLAAEGPINQDQIKRLTRAGMGACQGRRCREQVQVLLAMQGNQPTGSIAMPSYRAPLRPLPLSVLSAHDESAEMRQHWVVWFGIPSQWLPQWEAVPDVVDPRDDRMGLKDVVK